MKTVAWIDRGHKEYSMEEIEDRYLLNILRFLTKGGGYTYFLTNKKIEDLFNEANNRGLKHDFSMIDAIHMREEKDFITELDRIGFREEDFW